MSITLEIAQDLGSDLPSVVRAIAQRHPAARVTIDETTMEVRVEGRVDAREALAALAEAGIAARLVDRGHEAGGHDCCGGCF